VRADRSAAGGHNMPHRPGPGRFPVSLVHRSKETSDMSETSEIAILTRIFDKDDTPMSPEMARGILAMNFPEEDRKRMDELAEKARCGTLTPGERAEAEQYERAGHFLSILRSKARMTLRKEPGSKGRK